MANGALAVYIHAVESHRGSERKREREGREEFTRGRGAGKSASSIAVGATKFSACDNAFDC